MNFRNAIHQIGLLLLGFGGLMGALVPVVWVIGKFDGRSLDLNAAAALLLSCAACMVVGAAAWFLTRRCKPFIGRREALLLVALSWLIGALFAAMPFFIWATWFSESSGGVHRFASFVNCYFEAMSGLTTTGATILADIEAVPRELLLWRSFTQWVGGLGIVVLFVAVLPSLGVGGKKLYQVEAPGPSHEGLQPRIIETARFLLIIYLGLTALEILALLFIGGMQFFDAVCHTFTTLATAGFSTHNASIGYYYNKPAVDLIVILFMVLSAANFGLYHQLWRGRLRAVWKDTELRLYFGLLVVGSLIITLAVHNSGQPITLTATQADGAPITVQPTFVNSLRQSVVTTVSIGTTTGYCASDYSRWSFMPQAVLVMFMFIGGCSGSTAGGIKVIRVWLALKVLLGQIERVYSPNVTRPLRVADATVDTRLQLGAVAYVLGIVVLFAIGWVALMLIEQANPASNCSPTTAAGASLATLCTIGPGLDGVGATQNYGWFSAPSKILMCVLMALGRLEVFAIVVLLKPTFWRGQ